VNIIDIVL